MPFLPKNGEETDFENGRAPSRAKAYAIRVSANIAEHPVKNWTRMTKNHIAVPPFTPPAFKKIWAAGRPVGLEMIASKSVVQKHIVTVKIQPRIPEIVTAQRIAIGPLIAASCVSSDMCVVPS